MRLVSRKSVIFFQILNQLKHHELLFLISAYKNRYKNVNSNKIDNKS